MLKLCIVIAVIGYMAILSEGQTFNRQQAAHAVFQQQQYIQQLRQRNRFKQFYTQQNPSIYNRNAYNKYFLNNYYSTLGFVPQRAVITNDGLARTLLRYKDARPDGSYQYAYETENGIRGEERNIPKSLKPGETSGNAEGSYAYTSPEGLQVLVNYEADEDGFRPILSYSGNRARQFINSPNPSSVIINKNR